MTQAASSQAFKYPMAIVAFIGGLAFEHGSMDIELVIDERLGILLGSLLSGVAGYLVLKLSLRGPQGS